MTDTKALAARLAEKRKELIAKPLAQIWDDLASEAICFLHHAPQAPDHGVLQDDLRQMLQALGMNDGAQPKSPHEVFQEALAEMRRRLAATELAGVPAFGMVKANGELLPCATAEEDAIFHIFAPMFDVSAEHVRAKLEGAGWRSVRVTISRDGPRSAAMNVEPDDEAHAFEKAVREIWNSHGYTFPKENGQYLHSEVRTLWRVWQARASFPAQSSTAMNTTPTTPATDQATLADLSQVLDDIYAELGVNDNESALEQIGRLKAVRDDYMGLPEGERHALPSFATPAPDQGGVRAALEHARARFACLADQFEESGDEASWAMCSVDQDRMEKALTALTVSQKAGPRPTLEQIAEIVEPGVTGRDNSQAYAWGKARRILALFVPRKEHGASQPDTDALCTKDQTGGAA